MAARRRRVNRVATISVHTSPLDQPGTGDAGGMNVYIVEVARRLADLGIEVEIFTRRTARDLPPAVELHPGVLVRHVTAEAPVAVVGFLQLVGDRCEVAVGTGGVEIAGRDDLRRIIGCEVAGQRTEHHVPLVVTGRPGRRRVHRIQPHI